jgi:phosphocarrier protein
MSGSAAENAVLLAHDAGLHARPSLKLTMLAKTFAAKIELSLSADGPWIDAKSIVKVMASRAPKGSVLHFRASGADAALALQALIDLINRDFDEGKVERDEGPECPTAQAVGEDRADG